MWIFFLVDLVGLRDSRRTIRVDWMRADTVGMLTEGDVEDPAGCFISIFFPPPDNDPSCVRSPTYVQSSLPAFSTLASCVCVCVRSNFAKIWNDVHLIKHTRRGVRKKKLCSNEPVGALHRWVKHHRKFRQPLRSFRETTRTCCGAERNGERKKIDVGYKNRFCVEWCVPLITLP